MKKANSTLFLLVFATAMVFLCSCSGDSGSGKGSDPYVPFAPGSDAVSVSFLYTPKSGSASNQFAVWIETEDGTYVRTLMATRFTAKGGYTSRPDSLPAWVEKSARKAMGQTLVDAISTATPQAGTVTLGWDMMDESGNQMPDGVYVFCLEATLRWDYRTILRIAIDTRDGAYDTYKEDFGEVVGADRDMITQFAVTLER